MEETWWLASLLTGAHPPVEQLPGTVILSSPSRELDTAHSAEGITASKDMLSVLRGLWLRGRKQQGSGICGELNSVLRKHLQVPGVSG